MRFTIFLFFVIPLASASAIQCPAISTYDGLKSCLTRANVDQGHVQIAFLFFLFFSGIMWRLCSLWLCCILAAKTAALQSLQLILPSYSFINLALNSKINTSTSAGTIYDQHVDLMAGLNNVARSVQTNDAELQQAITDVFVPLHDAHTRYNKVLALCI